MPMRGAVSPRSGVGGQAVREGRFADSPSTGGPGSSPLPLCQLCRLGTPPSVPALELGRARFVPGASASARGAAARFGQGAGRQRHSRSTLSPGPASAQAVPGSVQQPWGFHLGLFPFSLAGRVLDWQCLVARTSCTGAPLLPEPLALALLWAVGQEQAALLATQLVELLWACCERVGPPSCCAGAGMCPPAPKPRNRQGIHSVPR